MHAKRDPLYLINTKAKNIHSNGMKVLVLEKKYITCMLQLDEPEPTVSPYNFCQSNPLNTLLLLYTLKLQGLSKMMVKI